MKHIAIKIAVTLLIVTAIAGCNDNDKPEPVNNAPTAVGVALTTQTNIPIIDTLVGNDVDGDILEYAIVIPPISGTLTLDSNGSFTYQPPLDQTGNDIFEFSVSDGINSAAIATVNITIENLEVNFSEYSRQAFSQNATDEPLSLKGRTFIQDIEDENAFDDLLMDN